ncbi:protein kinase [Xanthomonadaceae bacterium JHOS43]|nr:protein kinase [Xanthomonadaceae bacterium JHOS43]
MTLSEAEQFARIEVLLDAALELPPDQRVAYLESVCEDITLRDQVRELLLAVDVSEGFLEAPLPAATDHSGHHTGPWRLVRRVGRGGMGEVWLGERADGRFEQQVAVKLLRHHGSGDAGRMLREQRMLARLQHPNIARLIDAGNQPDGSPYMVMEYIEGVPLIQHCRERRLPIEARLALFVQVCDAVAFAHRHLIVHRDLKPDNILVRADGQPVLLDFGIARLIDDDGTETRELRLTPRYAAPEQLAGEEESTLTDVYALGLLLHELLTDRSPWGEAASLSGAVALLQRAQAGPPPPPSEHASRLAAKRLRGDLDAIVLKALRPEPFARYVSAEAMADDVRRHLSHAPVKARGDALGYRLRRLLRRYWVAASVAMLVLAGLLGTLTTIALARQEAIRERDTAQVEAMRSKAVRDYLAHMFRDASQQAREGSPLTAKQVLDQAAARVQASFVADPGTNAEVLKALGELHFHIGDYAAAAPLLRRWLTHEDTIADPVNAADVRFTLAEAAHNMGDRDEATRLLDEAQAFWEADPERHIDVLLTSRTLQARLQRERGDTAAALGTLETALSQRLQRSGRDHFETAVLYTNLGAAYVQAGRIDEGITASQEAMRLWRTLDLDTGNDALNTLNNLAAAQFRKGDFAAAEHAFAEALALRRSLFGPSAATAALIGNYARTLHRLERHGEALEYAGEAEAMAQTHAGSASPLMQSARVTRAELLLALDRASDALEPLAAFGREDIRALPPTLPLRAALALAESHQRLGEAELARLALEEANQWLPRSGPEQDAFRTRLQALERALEHR